MRLISWNVRGLRACLKGGFDVTLKTLQPDVICLQETKVSPGLIHYQPEGYQAFWNYPQFDHKGFGGVAIFSKVAPLSVTPDIGTPEDVWGRSLTAEFEDFILVTVYTPVKTSGSMSEYKETRLRWEEDLFCYLQTLCKTKPVIVCGDFNASLLDIDVPDPKAQKNSVGFHDWERGALRRLQENGFIDSFRKLHPDEAGAYSWWWNEKNREENKGLRLDFFFVDERLEAHITGASILQDVKGSDHCPIDLFLDL